MIKLFFDGSCFPNPHGVARYAFIFYDDKNQIIAKDSQEFLRGYGATSNLSEWYALYKGVEFFKHHVANDHLIIFGDSRLVVNQITNKCKVNKDFRYYYEKTHEILENIKWDINWINREQNKECHRLIQEKICFSNKK